MGEVPQVLSVRGPIKMFLSRVVMGQQSESLPLVKDSPAAPLP